ncbi:MAG: YdiU family protein [Oligoflexia bacterium]|nr:YdiU family protein [Oligoflexia bacterium]
MKIPGLELTNGYSTLPPVLFSRVSPTAVRAPSMLVFNFDLARQLGMEVSAISSAQLAQVFAGNVSLEGADPLAQAYAGHQYGHFTMLGDGRAIVLGELRAATGLHYEIQLKGAGQTEYSRQGDGRAALAPMLREYLVSEAMHALGIPSTRSLAVVASGESVMRERELPGAVLTRIARSHIRIGTFEFAALQQDREVLRRLVEFSVERLYPELNNSSDLGLDFLKAVIARHVRLVVEWIRVGFVHGVMNTDNMAISGETIDYGPCAFIDRFDPAKVFSSIDRHGRYAFMRQPAIMLWNLERLAQCILPILRPAANDSKAVARAALQEFPALFENAWLEMMRGKLGLCTTGPEDEALALDLLEWMRSSGADYTNTFYQLHPNKPCSEELSQDPVFKSWYARWQKRLGQEKNLEQSSALMARANPGIIPRNHKLEEALNSAQDAADLGQFQRMLKAVSQPYDNESRLGQASEYTLPPRPEQEVQETFCGT